MNRYSKGETIATIPLHVDVEPPFHWVVPLFDLKEVERWVLSLPRFRIGFGWCSDLLAKQKKSRTGDNEEDERFIRILQKPDIHPEILKIAIFMLIHGQARPFLELHSTSTIDTDADAADADELQLLLQLLSAELRGMDNKFLLKDDDNEWKRLLAILRKSHIRWVHQTHPLVEYASKVIPKLDDDQELLRVVEMFNLDDDDKTTTRKHSKLAVQKMIRDRFVTQTCSFAVIIVIIPCRDDTTTTTTTTTLSPLLQYSHSCLPNAHFEIGNDGGTILVTALYDIHNHDDEDNDPDPITVCFCRLDDTWEDRDRCLSEQALLGSCCTCERCRYEMDATDVMIPNSRNGIVRLARYYMGRSDWKNAKSLYQKAISQDTTTNDCKDPNDCNTTADIYHALGAIAMAENQFVEAQRIWKKGLHCDNGNSQKHAGLALQASKMKAYGYFETTVPIATTNKWNEQTTTWMSPIPGVFLTPNVVDECKCRRIIDWIEQQGSWTQQRHYAVPTYDIPIHETVEVLDWFQNDLMVTMQKMLRSQFQKSTGRFYVHDAFCVRYDAGSISNHLPIHTDESTHSFVLALNNQYSGGGTYFFDFDKTIRVPSGSILSFAGENLLHGGEPVTSGSRYIIAVFLYYDETENGVESSNVTKRKFKVVNEKCQKIMQGKKSFLFDFDLGA